jgi:Spy/CpxP family protein refolding chaperone
VTKVVVIFGFLMAFAAGLIVGMNRPQRLVANAPTDAKPSSSTTRPGPRGPGELDALLNLRPEQKEQLKKIWSDMAERGRKQHEERRNQLREQRDQKIQSLLTPEQKAQFEKAHADYDEQRKALDREMRANFEQAVEATKAVLDPDQKVKYEQWLAKRSWDRGPRGGDRGGPPEFENHRRPDAGATSTPSNQP